MAKSFKLGDGKGLKAGQVKFRTPGVAILAGLMIGLAAPQWARAQTPPAPTTQAPTTQAPSARPSTATGGQIDTKKDAKPEAGQEQQAVVRLARFSYVKGNVKFRADSTAQWADATVNMPLREGAQITTDGDARAEIQFDDGSTLRMTDSAVIALKSLFSDEDGEFTELSMTDGTATLHALNPFSIYQIDTPDGDVKAEGPAKIRLDAASYLKVGIEDGKATFTTLDGETKLEKGDLAEVEAGRKTPEIEDLPAPDDWDQFCDSRDGDMPTQDPHLPSDVALDAGNLDNYGTWQTDQDYGDVWYPSAQDADWQPYSQGSWTWVQPFGWTWVSLEAWGWAPYHYGTWIHRPHGWAWVPGPKRQHWSPAVVWFTTVGETIAWVPLAPCEVHYTAVDVNFHHGDWSKYFSVGAAGVYVAAGKDYVVARPWNSVALNKDSISSTRLTAKPVDHAFGPHNARYGGAVKTTLANFQSGKSGTPLHNDSLSLFEHGDTMVSGGAQPLAGPANVRPTQTSLSPTRKFTENELYRSKQDRAVFVAHGRQTATAAPAKTSSAGNEWRPKADWNSASSAATAAAKARQALGYVRPRTTPPDQDGYVRRVPLPVESEEENSGYGGYESYESRALGSAERGERGNSREEGGNSRGWGHRGTPPGSEGNERGSQPREQQGAVQQMRAGQFRQQGPPMRFNPPRQQGGGAPRQAAPPQNGNNRH